MSQSRSHCDCATFCKICATFIISTCKLKIYIFSKTNSNVSCNFMLTFIVCCMAHNCAQKKYVQNLKSTFRMSAHCCQLQAPNRHKIGGEAPLIQDPSYATSTALPFLKAPASQAYCTPIYLIHNLY